MKTYAQFFVPLGSSKVLNGPLVLSNKIVTTFAAIQFIMIHVITSFTFKKALKIPGTEPHNAAAKIPDKNAKIQTMIGGTTDVGIESATISVTAVLIKY